MSVNLAKGVYYCHGCEIKGNAYNYLLDIRGMTKKEALELLKGGGWTEQKLQKSQDEIAQKSNAAEGLPKSAHEPWDKLGGKMATAVYDYRNAEGGLVARVVRYAEPHIREGKDKPDKSIMEWVPKASGGWWLCAATNSNIPDCDRVDKMPLYQLPHLLTKLDRQIWIVEGEKCVDAVLSLPRSKETGKHWPPPTTSIRGAKKSFDKVDLVPLYGGKRRVLLIADTDKASRAHMRALAAHLHAKGTAVRLILPQGEGGYDIADAIGEGGYESMMKWLTKTPAEDYVAGEEQHGKPEQTVEQLDDNDYFRVLGIDNNRVVFQSKANWRLIAISEAGLNQEGNLMRLAPIEWWRSQMKGNLTATDRATIGSGLIRMGEDRGLIDIQDVASGRGAMLYEGEPIFNLGNRILIEGEDGRLSEERSFDDLPNMVWAPGPAVHLPDIDDDLGRQYCFDLAQCLMEWRFKTENMTRALLGWIVASLIGGCLKQRPIVWVMAPPDSGKTFLMNDVLSPVFDDLGRFTGDTTAAGILDNMNNDSLP